jgi:hypothetical protein
MGRPVKRTVGALSAAMFIVRTHRVARLSAGGPDAKLDGEILQYRVVDGTWIAFKNRQSEGSHTMVQTLATYDYVALDPALRPAAAPPLERAELCKGDEVVGGQR